MEFMGYQRNNDSFGIRNHILIMSSVSCANGVVDALGRIFPDAITLQHAYGCGYGPDDFTVSLRILSGILNNPNVGAVLVIGLGCELLKSERLAQAAKGKPAEAISIQQGGSATATKKGIEIVKKFIKHTKMARRVPSPVSQLIIGLKCGGSDAFSGVTANPAVGVAADLFVQEGATVIMGETTEMIGTAHILKKRCMDQQLGNRVEKMIFNQEKQVHDALGKLAGLVIAPGNIDGGLSSITEKSLGCIAKSGSTPINELIAYGNRPSKKGLVVMDTPGYDIDSMAGMASAGAQMIIFTTGRGTPAGFPAVPVIKVSSNTQTYRNMTGDIDINAGSILDESKSVEAAGRDIFDFSLRVASGATTRAEINKSIPFNCLKQGPTF
ncbi:MAG: UxaA family hydrolase [Chloroflexi bacterium]|nr:UxaA family hydrolase [Chloroflexota bacterium]